MATSAPDPADEAGGEIVFSSDGLSPLPTIKPPPVAQDAAAGGTGAGEAVLDSGNIRATDAFEVFSGKIFSVQSASASSAVRRQEEGPLERLARLQGELRELETELRSTASNSGREFDEQVLKLASDLQTRMTEASKTARLSEQDELTRLIKAQMQIQQQKATGEKTGADTVSGSGSGDSPTGVVYELYGSTQGPTTKTEDRLTKIERLMGSSTASSQSLMSRLDELERLVQHIDGPSMEQAASKAKVIRADLEAASKARTKLSATYKKEDSKMIQQLYQQMVDLDGLSQHLPALTDRLQQLATLHVQSSNFATRLSETETQASQVQSGVLQLEQTMAQLQAQMTENAKNLEENMKKLDSRLSQLN